MTTSIKKVLLARPSVFIVNDMRRLLTDLSFYPTPIKVLDEINLYQKSELVGAVISTAIQSEVKEDYAQVAKALKQFDAGLPIMLATLVPFENLVKALKLKFESNGLSMNFYSIKEASKQFTLNPIKDALVIHRDDITSESDYQITFSTVQKFFR